MSNPGRVVGATLLSTVLPGVGHYLNRNPTAGTVYLISETALFVPGIIMATADTLNTETGKVMLIVSGVLHIINIVHTGIAGARLQKKRKTEKVLV